MAWQNNDGTRVCQNLGPFTSGAEAIWSLCKLLVNAAGWTLVDSDDNASGAIDMVTYQGTGVNGLDRSNAWILLRDPGASREYLFIRSSTGHYSWYPMYSTAGFGAAAHPTPPTAADEVNLYLATGRAYAPGLVAPDGTSQRTRYSLFPIAMNHRVHCAVNDAVASDTDVYCWWMFIAASGTGVEGTTLICDARVGEGGLMTPGTADASVYYCNATAPVVTSLTSKTFDATGRMFGGFYGGEFDGFTCRYHYAGGASMEPYASSGPNVDNSRYALLPFEIFRSNSAGFSVPGDAGFLWNNRWNPDRSTFLYTSYFDDETFAAISTPDHLFATNDDAELRGWYSNATGPLT